MGHARVAWGRVGHVGVGWAVKIFTGIISSVTN